MGIDWNRIIKDRAGEKIKRLDIKNGGDQIKTMREFMVWARKGTGERASAVDYGDRVEVGVNKDITYRGIKGHGWCIVEFNKYGDVLGYRY
jgi:hypothetical protein